MLWIDVTAPSNWVSSDGTKLYYDSGLSQWVLNWGDADWGDGSNGTVCTLTPTGALGALYRNADFVFLFDGDASDCTLAPASCGGTVYAGYAIAGSFAGNNLNNFSASMLRGSPSGSNFLTGDADLVHAAYATDGSPHASFTELDSYFVLSSSVAAIKATDGAPSWLLFTRSNGHSLTAQAFPVHLNKIFMVPGDPIPASFWRDFVGSEERF